MEKSYSEQYLDHHLEPKKSDRSETIQTPLELQEPFIEHDWQREGKIEFKKGDTEVIMEYSTPNFSEIFKAAFFSNLFSKTTLNLLQRKFKNLDNLSLKNNKKQLELSKILPSNFLILFNPDSKISNGKIDSQNSILLIESSPMTPEGLLVVMHEVGHFQAAQAHGGSYSSDIQKAQRHLNEEQALMGRAFYHTGSNAGSAAHVLKGERDAWAQALQNIRPFMDDLQISQEDTKKIIHGQCLGTYSDFIRSLT